MESPTTSRIAWSGRRACRRSGRFEVTLTETENNMSEQLMKCGHTANAVLKSRAGQKIDPPIPSCAICDCTEPAPDVPSLEGRTAICSYRYGAKGVHAKCPSEFALPFFEYKGPGSRHALTRCKCGYYEVAHSKPGIKCRQFTAVGPSEFDEYYCGCHGWD